MDWDVIVAGGGVAGLSAALTLARARRRVLVIDGGEPRNRFAAHMHGVLGHEGVDPRELIATGRAEAKGYGAELVDGSVEHVGAHDDGLTITTAGRQALRCRALIVASGIDDRLPDIPCLAERWGTSVLHCPYCHGWEVRDQRLGVIASSPMALHQVQLLRQWSDDIVFFTAGASLDPDTQRRLAARGIELVASRAVEVIGDGPRVSGVRTEDGRIVALDAVFTTGTPQPRDGFLAGLGLDRADTPLGSFLAVDPTGKTSHDRIWAAGNVSNPAANVVMAISAGAVAAAAVNMALVDEDFNRAATEQVGQAGR